VLTQFGFAHGWRMAEAMQAEFKWDSDEDWRRAGAWRAAGPFIAVNCGAITETLLRERALQDTRAAHSRPSSGHSPC
jgi:hypothetical protein